ncbi:MAG TPA: helix-turn-helix transcriptional regulator [Polyangiaceae bacterium]
MGRGPDDSDWGALTAVERRVLGRAMGGCPNKSIAIDLRLAGSTIAGYLAAAARKLGVGSRVELIRTCHRDATRAPPRVAAPAELTAATLARLTPAENDVVLGILSGQSNAEIAARRRRSTRTVANQIASIYRKLGVSSRSDLAARAFMLPGPAMAVPSATWTSEPRSG